MNHLRVMLADDHKILRQALRSVLEQESDIDIVGEAENGIEALSGALASTPDVVVMDIGMPGMNGIEVTRRVLKEHPEIGVVALSTYSDPRIALQMIEAGARGYVIKAAGSDELLRAVRAVANGEYYICPELTALLTKAERQIQDRRAQPRQDDGAEDRRLGQREREILQLLSDGRSAPEIAEQLHLAASVIEVHLAKMMHKLELKSITELTAHAILSAQQTI